MTTPVAAGSILAGKYRVDRVLGEGGMGVVVAAHHLELDDKVAIKFLLPETLGNPEAVARFSREARAAVKIKSEHVARVSDVGKLENGAPYMVMEFLEGSDLSGWLAEKGPLPVEQAVEFILQASEAIAEAHALGIVHRDLKPANLFVIRRADGALSIKVLDFGISKMTSLSGSGGEGSMTRTSTMMGSPIYMSPEQIQSSKDVDARGDIWALGVILYELVTGSAPFGGEHITELIYSIISAPMPPMQARQPLPPGFEAVVARCLEKHRANRYGSIAEMATALLPFAPKRSLASVERITGVITAKHGLSGVATVAYPAGGTAQAVTGAGTQANFGTTAAAKEKTPWLWIGISGAVLSAAAVALVLRLASGGSHANATQEPPAALTQIATAKPEPVPQTPPSAVATAAAEPSVAPTASAATASALAASAPPAASATPKPNAQATQPRTPKQPKPPSKPAGPSDPWGGSQH